MKVGRTEIQLKCLQDPISTNITWISWCTPVILAMKETFKKKKEAIVQAGIGINTRMYLKNNQGERTEGVAQMVGCLPSSARP
jgi:hypothetical protein